jgi:hypothetical protein
VINDEIVVVKPTRVYVGTDRSTDEVRRAVVVDDLVSQWWVPEGAELVGEFAIEPWIEHGIRTQGWRLVRKKAAQVVPEVDAPVMGVRWATVAEQMYDALRHGEVELARDLYVTAEMQTEMLTEHEHRFGPEPNPTTLCSYPGCSLRYENRPTEPPAQDRLDIPVPEWDDEEDGRG